MTWPPSAYRNESGGDQATFGQGDIGRNAAENESGGPLTRFGQDGLAWGTQRHTEARGDLKRGSSKPKTAPTTAYSYQIGPPNLLRVTILKDDR